MHLWVQGRFVKRVSWPDTWSASVLEISLKNIPLLALFFPVLCVMFLWMKISLFIQPDFLGTCCGTFAPWTWSDPSCIIDRPYNWSTATTAYMHGLSLAFFNASVQGLKRTLHQSIKRSKFFMWAGEGVGGAWIVLIVFIVVLVHVEPHAFDSLPSFVIFFLWASFMFGVFFCRQLVLDLLLPAENHHKALDLISYRTNDQQLYKTNIPPVLRCPLCKNIDGHDVLMEFHLSLADIYWLVPCGGKSNISHQNLNWCLLLFLSPFNFGGLHYTCGYLENLERVRFVENLRMWIHICIFVYYKWNIFKFRM